MTIEEFHDYDAPVEGRVVHPPQRTHYVVTPRPVAHGSTAADRARLAAKVAVCVPRGAWRVTSKLVALTVPAKPAPNHELALLRDATLYARTPDKISVSDYATIRRLEAEDAAARAAAPASGRVGCMTLVICLVVAGFFGLWAWLTVEAWLPTPLAVLWQMLTPVVVLGVLGAVGWRPGTPTTPSRQAVHPVVAAWMQQPRQPAAPAVEAAPAADNTDRWVLDALDAIGVKGARTTGPAGHVDGGWSIDVTLPPGTTAASVVGKREHLASALGRPLACVHPEPRPDVSPAALCVFVSDVAMSAATCPPVPYTGQETTIFEPMRLGVDVRGRAVSVPVAAKTWLVAGLTGSGKSVTMLSVLGYAASDPRTRLVIMDLKGAGDFEAYRPAAETFVSASDDADAPRAAVATLRALQDDMTRTYRTLSAEGLGGKVTDRLAERRDLAPVVLVIDECQELTGDDSPVKDDATAALADLAKRARAAGWCIVLGTQKPTGDAIPTRVRDMAHVRVAHRLLAQPAVDAVLGTGAYSRGWDSTTLPEDAAGLAWVRGEGSGATMVQTHNALPAVDRIADRAAEARAMLDPTPAQEAHETAQHTPAARLLALWPVDAAGLHWTEVESLIGTDSTDELRATLRDAGITSRDVKRNGSTRKGVRREHVEEVADTRD